MKPMQNIYFLFLLVIAFSCDKKDEAFVFDPNIEENIYFPPLNSDVWETKSINELGWNEDAKQPLLDFLDQKNTKGFIILYDGKIVIEEYFNGHTQTSPWYWASAGKTLTTTLTGIAESEGLLNINEKVSDYLGQNWTSLQSEKENLITCRSLLTMTSGLDDSLGDETSPSNLVYLDNAGNRWAYHNVYVKLQDVVASATNMNWDNYFNSRLKNKIGMSGAWVTTSNFNVYWSTTRSMARFGLVNYANGKWEDEQIIPTAFLNESINTSQELNESYGYLWWLNGKNSYRLPQTQLQFNGSLIPNAPDDMYCALGKNDQKIYISPSKKLVVIRMGNAADTDTFALSSFDNDLWEKLNDLIN